MGKKRKVHSLTGRIDDRLMMQAFKAVKKNRGAAGIDKVSIGMFEQNLDAMEVYRYRRWRRDRMMAIGAAFEASVDGLEEEIAMLRRRIDGEGRGESG